MEDNQITDSPSPSPSPSLSAQTLKVFAVVAKAGHGSFPLGQVCRSTWNDESLWKELLQAPSSPPFKTTEHAHEKDLIKTKDSIEENMADMNGFTADEEKSDSSSTEERVSFSENRSSPSEAKEWRISITKVRYNLHYDRVNNYAYYDNDDDDDDDYGNDNGDFNYHREIPEGSRWLLAASACGHTARVAWLCRLNPPEYALDGALLLAAFYGHVETIGVLIAAGAHVDAERALLPKRCQPLGLLGYRGYYDDEQLHIKGRHVTPLLVAISFGNLSLVQQFISLGADTREAANAAAFSGDLNVLSAVLDTGINIDAIEYFHSHEYRELVGTPLCSALYSDKMSDDKALDVVYLLLARGAKPWVAKVDTFNKSTLELALRRKNVDILRLLVDATMAGGNSSNSAATAAVERLRLQSLFSIDHNRMSQFSSLEQQHLVGLHNVLLDAVKYLVSCGADVKAASIALNAAAAIGRSDIVEALIDAGADIENVRSFSDYESRGSRFSVLCESLISCHEDTVQLLLTRGARPWIRCSYNDPSPLIRAVYLAAEKKDSIEDRATFIPKLVNLTLARALEPASDDSIVALEELCLFLSKVLDFSWEGPSRESVCDSVTSIARSVANGSLVNPTICAGSLRASVWMSRIDLVSLLLDSNAGKTEVNSISKFRGQFEMRRISEIRHDESPLSLAIKAANVDIIRLLLSRGALPLGTNEIVIHNVFTPSFHSDVQPLYFAVHLGRCDLLKIIVDSAITGIQAVETRSIIYKSVQEGYEIDRKSKSEQEKYREVFAVLFDVMINDVCKSTLAVSFELPFVLAAYFGRNDAIERLLNAGVDINARLIVQLPCHTAENTKMSNRGRQAIVRAHNCSAIDAAIAEGRTETVSRLLALGARPCLTKEILIPLARFKNTSMPSTSAPLLYYMSNKNAEMLKLLLNAASAFPSDDLHLQENYAEIAKKMQLPTLLHMIVKERIDFSRGRNNKDEQVNTSHVACENVIVDAAVGLLARKFPAAVLGNNALAAFALAVREDAIKSMRLAGVDVHSSESLMALKIAIDAGSVEAVRMLIEHNMAHPMSSISDEFFKILEGALHCGQNNKLLAALASVADERPPLEVVLALMNIEDGRSLKCLKGVLTEYGQLTASKTFPFGSLLRSAALEGFVDEVRLLVHLGVDLSDRVPIVSASCLGPNVSSVILERWKQRYNEEREEERDSRRTQNSTALILAVRGLASMSIGCSSYLDEGSEIDRMQGYVDTVRALVDAGADINAADVFGINALCEARRGRDNAWARAVEGAEFNCEGLFYDRDREALCGRRDSGSSDGSKSSRKSMYRPHKAGYALEKSFDEILVILGDSTVRRNRHPW
jgi:ankyrin repeat protein